MMRLLLIATSVAATMMAGCGVTVTPDYTPAPVYRPYSPVIVPIVRPYRPVVRPHYRHVRPVHRPMRHHSRPMRHHRRGDIVRADSYSMAGYDAPVVECVFNNTGNSEARVLVKVTYYQQNGGLSPLLRVKRNYITIGANSTKLASFTMVPSSQYASHEVIVDRGDVTYDCRFGRR